MIGMILVRILNTLLFSIKMRIKNIRILIDARILALLGDSVTTDHISPAGSIKEDSPAGIYLNNRQINSKNFNSYGSRRGNHEIMMRGTFANIRIKNEILPGTEGGLYKIICIKQKQCQFMMFLKNILK